jgi:hypothetical protein
MMMMSYAQAKRSGMILCATVEHPIEEAKIDRILLGEASKACPGLSLSVKTIKHFDPFLRAHGDYVRAVFPAADNV